MPDPPPTQYRLARTIRVYAEFWVRALTTILKFHWNH